LSKILAFLAQTTASFSKNLIITSVFEKTSFFADYWKKLQKIVIIALTPGNREPNRRTSFIFGAVLT
jgi:hypothetical protein